MVEKVMAIGELVDYLQQKQHHSVERTDSVEMKDLKYTFCFLTFEFYYYFLSPSCRASGFNISEGQSSAMPQVNITVVVNGKLSGHLKRRYHDQVSTILENLELVCRSSHLHPSV